MSAIITWKELLHDEKQKEYFQKVLAFQKEERGKGRVIFPPEKDIFNAFANTPLEDLKVVILGQDPYHGEDQAEGLCFSVSPSVPPPPSLKNIFKELETDIGIKNIPNGSLKKWCSQGVFLLNAVLTVEKNMPASHAKRGWENFTDEVIKKISDHKEHVVFILWGNFAKGKIPLIDTGKHTIITSPHPSPFSAYSGFFGSKPFSKTNIALVNHGQKEIDWGL